MSHTMLAAYMVVDAAIAIGLFWLLREVAKTDRGHMMATLGVRNKERMKWTQD